MSRRIHIAVLFGIALAAPALGQKPSTDHSGHRAEAGARAVAPTEGEVRKVDKAANKITIKHGPIPNIEMPPMTMVFQVKDPKMLEQLKAGDKIRFTAEKSGDTYRVTSIQR